MPSSLLAGENLYKGELFAMILLAHINPVNTFLHFVVMARLHLVVMTLKIRCIKGTGRWMNDAYCEK